MQICCVGVKPRVRGRLEAVEIDTKFERRNVTVEEVVYISFVQKRFSPRVDAAAREADGHEVID